MPWFVPAIAGFAGVIVMTLALRRSRFFGLPETQMIRAMGSLITKDPKTALMPGFVIHASGGIFFAYFYSLILSTAPGVEPGAIGFWIVVIVCTLMGVVHGLIVTLFLVISVAQYHPVEEFRKLEAGDMAAHVIGHIVYGFTTGVMLAWLPTVLG